MEGTSRLSPYLHFGHIGPHTVALAVKKAHAPESAREAFLEDLIVRRELAINFIRYNPRYENFESGPPWGHRTIAEHASDERPVRYSEEQLEKGDTHDPLWNAAHKQMVLTGWMHNYMRMYWAKKIFGMEQFSTGSLPDRCTFKRQVRAGRARSERIRGDCLGHRRQERSTLV